MSGEVWKQLAYGAIAMPGFLAVARMARFLTPPAKLESGHVAWWRHLRAVGALPFNVIVTVPAILVKCVPPPPGGVRPLFGLKLSEPLGLLAAAVGTCCAALGTTLFVWTNRLFHAAGGTLAPMDPPRNFVVAGPYRYARNPMITGFFSILGAEALFLGRLPILGFMAAFLGTNTIYLVYKEEPELLERFGADYEEYRRHVPRWVPRLTPWTPR